MRILCVDDNATIRKVIDLILAATGADVEFAVNGALGVEAFKAARFDAVLMDMEMPEMNGLEAACAIRAHEFATQSDHTPLVFLSGHEDEAFKNRALAAGADEFLIKPFTSEALISTLDRVLKTANRTELKTVMQALK
jgi:CheY-like chemotaxis protein